MSPLSPGCRPYPPACKPYSPTRRARVYEPEAEPEAGVDQSRALWTRIFTKSYDSLSDY